MRRRALSAAIAAMVSTRVEGSGMGVSTQAAKFVPFDTRDAGKPAGSKKLQNLFTALATGALGYNGFGFGFRQFPRSNTSSKDRLMIRNLALTLLFTAVCCAPAKAATFDWATVGTPGNADDTHGDGYGGVDYTYRISKHEVTNAQYTEFLNAVAATDTYGLYNTAMGSDSWGGITRSGDSGSYTYSVKAPAVGHGPGGSDYTYDNKPMVYVSFIDAMRFVNWLHNGQGSGGTESGVYTIGTGTNEVRSAGAKFWIPSEDEWYKAAYYDPNGNGGSGAYYDYPTSTDTTTEQQPPFGRHGQFRELLRRRIHDRQFFLSEDGCRCVCPLAKSLRHVRPGRQRLGVERSGY